MVNSFAVLAGHSLSRWHAGRCVFLRHATGGPLVLASPEGVPAGGILRRPGYDRWPKVEADRGAGHLGVAAVQLHPAAGYAFTAAGRPRYNREMRSQKYRVITTLERASNRLIRAALRA